MYRDIEKQVLSINPIVIEWYQARIYKGRIDGDSYYTMKL